MTAPDHEHDEQPDAPGPLLAGASPKAVSSRLPPQDRQRFAVEYEAALEQARRAYELTGVQELVEHWRQVAVLQSDPAAFRRSVRSSPRSRPGSRPPGASRSR